MFVIVACSRCRRARVAQESAKTTSCTSCGRSLTLARLKIFHRGADHVEAVRAAGLVNAHLAGRRDEFVTDLLPQAGAAPRHDDAYAEAAAAARDARGETQRVDAIARVLGRRLGDFAEADLQRAMEASGIPAWRADMHLSRMRDCALLFEPSPGRYRGTPVRAAGDAAPA